MNMLNNFVQQTTWVAWKLSSVEKLHGIMKTGKQIFALHMVQVDADFFLMHVICLVNFSRLSLHHWDLIEED